jgi:Protein of unknown function (DUF3304)
MVSKTTSIDPAHLVPSVLLKHLFCPLLGRDVKDRVVNAHALMPTNVLGHRISMMVRVSIVRFLSFALIASACAGAGLLSGCSEEEKISVGYRVVNHTDVGVVYITVDQQGGVLGANPRGESGDACCVNIPSQWRPELRVTVGWQDDSTEQLDAAGKPVMRDGKHVLIPGQKYSRTVPIQEYKPNNVGAMNLHILPDKNVIATVSMLTPTHPDYLPKNPLQRPRQP